MKNKTQLKNLKKIKIALSGKEVLRKEILEKVIKQGRPQGLTYNQFKAFAYILADEPKQNYLPQTRKIFTVNVGKGKSVQ